MVVLSLACEQAHLFGYIGIGRASRSKATKATKNLFFSPVLGCNSPFKQVSLLPGYVKSKSG